MAKEANGEGEEAPEDIAQLWSGIFEREDEQGAAITLLQSYRPSSFAAHAKTPSALADGSATQNLRNSGQSPDRPRSSAQKNTTAKAHFEILSELGAGGMGIVYRAKQNSLQREVAVKLLKRTDDLSIALFRSEAHVTGRLEHANITPVHFMTEDSKGLPQLGMKLVRGTAWSELIHAENTDDFQLKDHLKILLTVCNAVAYAHKYKILHRDIKPGNVMVGDFGQTFLVDWGLAVTLDKDLAAETCIVPASSVSGPSGTPGYMAPELAKGFGEEQDERTDVYLIGACLHEILTKTRKHEGQTMMSVFQKALDSKPYNYSDAVPQELATICNRATAQGKTERYQSVEDLHDAIDAYLDHAHAHSLIDKGEALRLRLTKVIAKLEKGAHEELEGEGEDDNEILIHQLFSESRFAFQNALEIWPQAEGAKKGRGELYDLSLDFALGHEDLKWARRLLTMMESPKEEQQARFEALESELTQRVVELQELKKSARQLDWSELSKPLGNLFIIAGLLGMLGCIATSLVWVHFPNHARAIFTLIWASFGIIIGGLALPLLWTHRGSVLAMRMFGIWGAVNIACLSNGMMNGIAGAPPNETVDDACFMFGIGLVASAFQARRWLLAPALLFFLGGWMCFIGQDVALEILAVLWAVIWCGIGLGLRLDEDFLKSEAE
jgi:eukaryotic-like serine/threonine-protein kinase